MSKILILNGSPRKNGKTASLVNAFTEGAKSAGNEVKDFYLPGMNISGCMGCEACKKNDGHCVQKDDMEEVNDAFLWADVIVFASPVYWGNISGQLKIAIDRLFALFNRYHSDELKKKCVLIMTAAAPMYELSQGFYGIFMQYLGWENLGEILGAGKEEEAKALGLSMQ